MFVLLVHSPLIGPGSWGPVARVLRDWGHTVASPDLHVGPPSSPFWRSQVDQAVATSSSRGDVPTVVVGHSGAGPLLPAIGESMHSDAYVLVDAALPHPGRSRLQALPAGFAARIRDLETGGRLPPWPEWFGPEVMAKLIPDDRLRTHFVHDSPALPFDMFEEPLPDVLGWPDAPCGYLQLSEAYDEECVEARDAGWMVAELPSGHLALITQPHEVASAVMAMADVLVP